MPTKPTVTSDTFLSRTGLGARRKAIRNWKSKTSGAYGSTWANWTKAKDKERIEWGPVKRAQAYVSGKPYKK